MALSGTLDKVEAILADKYSIRAGEWNIRVSFVPKLGEGLTCIVELGTGNWFVGSQAFPIQQQFLAGDAQEKIAEQIAKIITTYQGKEQQHGTEHTTPRTAGTATTHSTGSHRC